MTDGKERGCPMHASGAPSTYGETDLTYNDYLKVPTLLSLQIPQSSPAHHDEMLFIIIHQAYELWFKLVLHEMETAMNCMREGNVLRAHHFMNRINQIMKLLVQQIHILETMTPVEFLQFRDRLKPASGFQSLQFREVEFMAGLKEERYLKHFKNRPDYLATLEKRLKEEDLRGVFHGLLRAQGFAIPKGETEEDIAKTVRALLPIYRDPVKNSSLYMLCEALVDFDQNLGLWREHHVRVVERVIGFKQGTGGSSGVEYLRSTTSKKCFPALWSVRTSLED